jgi:hypothetical protein
LEAGLLKAAKPVLSRIRTRTLAPEFQTLDRCPFYYIIVFLIKSQQIVTKLIMKEILILYYILPHELTQKCHTDMTWLQHFWPRQKLILFPLGH